MDLDNEELEATRKMNGSKGKVYIRTEDGLIGKIKMTYSLMGVKYFLCDIGECIAEHDVVKKSNNINDILKIGDIIKLEVDGAEEFLIYNGKFTLENLENDAIVKKIFTVEKINRMGYEVNKK